MSQQTYIIRFEDVSLAEANRYAEELRANLLDASSDLSVQRQRGDQSTQDFGSTLVLVLGTPAIVTVATVIGNWLLQRSKASVTIERADNKLIVNNLSSKDAARLAELWLAQEKEST